MENMIEKYFDIDYPKDGSDFVGSLFDVYKKAFETATIVAKEESMLGLADAQFIGFKHGKWCGTDIIGLVESMGLTKSEWNKLKTDFPENLDEKDIEEIDNHFKS